MVTLKMEVKKRNKAPLWFQIRAVGKSARGTRINMKGGKMQKKIFKYYIIIDI